MDIAIYFEKINLGGDMFIFKPVSIIKGDLDEQDNIFVTDYGILCESINGEDPDYDSYFGLETTMEELRHAFPETDDQGALNEYFCMSIENYYVGYFDAQTNHIRTKMVPVSDLENVDSNENYNNKISSDLNQNSLYSEDQSTFIKKLNEYALKFNKDDDGIVNVGYGEPDVSFEIQKPNIISKNKRLIISLVELRKEVLKSIIGQDRAVNDVTRNIIINQSSSNSLNKSHILLAGPTGTGKTVMIKTICNIMDIPYLEADASQYIKSEYIEQKIYLMLGGLIESARGDIEKAQNGVLIINGVDKQIDDLSSTILLNSLSKILNRKIIEVCSDRNDYYFDTSNLTVVFMGNFVDIFAKKREEIKNLHKFESDIIIKQDDFLQNGVPLQLLSGTITNTNYLTTKNLCDIINNSKISQLLIQKQFFKDILNVELQYTSDYVDAVALKAKNSGTNAAQLGPIIKETVAQAFDDIVNRGTAKVLKLTKDTVSDNTKYQIL